MENKDMINMILREIEEGGVKLLTDNERRKLMVNSIRKYNQVLEEKVKFLEGGQEDQEDPKEEKKEDPKEDPKKTSYRELAESRNIRRK